MKALSVALTLSTVAWICPLEGQSPVEILNRTNVGTVNGSGEVQLKFDYLSTEAEHVYRIEKDGPGLFPVAGRWKVDTTESVGFYLRSDDTFYLRTAQSTGDFTLSFKFFSGTAPSGTLFPVMGDWDGDGIATGGIFNQTTGTAYLKNANATSAPIAHQITYPGVAGSSWRPVAGDWDGNGKDEVGLYRGGGPTFRLFNNVPSTTYSDYTVPFPTGAGGVWPLAGDWNADGKDFVGLYGTNNKTFYLLRSKTQLTTWDEVFTVPNATSRPVAGAWDGEALRYAVPKTANGKRPTTFPQLIDRGNGTHDLFFSAGVSSLPGIDSLYYNQYSSSHLYTNSGWQLGTSLELLGNDGATALGTVFISHTQVFKHPSGGMYRKMIAYVVEFPSTFDPPGKTSSGWVCLTYSNGNNTWTPPIFATTDPNSTPPPCVDSQAPGFGTPVLAELVSGFRDGNNLYLAVMNGDGDELQAVADVQGTNTETFLYSTAVTKPWHLTRQVEFSENGLSTPNTGGRWVYNLGINLDFTFDPQEFALYWSRLYPYPFNLDGGIPCNSTQCSPGAGLNPNRVQVYKLPLVPGESEAQHLERLATGTWQLVWDLGAPLGYPESVSGSCASAPLKGLQDGLLGIDINSATFVKDLNGVIARDTDGKRRLVFGGAAVKDRMNGECDFTDRSIFIWREP